MILASATAMHLLVYILLCCNFVQFSIGFNLENRLPIVKYGPENSYFGYSVASHIINENVVNTTKWLLIGAPLGQNLQPKTNSSGALYKCPITNDQHDCEQVITDGRPDGELDEHITAGLIEPNEQYEIKNGQWLGVTVRSQAAGGKVLVCAHRYIRKKSDSQFGQGLCYVLDNNLNYDDMYEPCKGRSVARAHEEYSYCQVGTSGLLLDDDTMVLGTPGPYTWRGTIFVISISGDYLRRDKKQYYGPHNEISSPVDKYSYLGMSVTGGKFFGDYMSYAAGAPRASGHGQVVIFSKGEPPDNPMAVSLIIDGDQFASSFGYEIVSADINGDGKTDLIVAAPFYFSRHNGGMVFVYQNKDFMLPKQATIKLTGKMESRFGLSLANIGDINKDYCDDLAIGAPYEDGGAVYIYLGSRDGLNGRPSQIITAASVGYLPSPLQTFGSSLSGGTDLDGNSYPDLIVGAYASSAVITLLARPITNIKTEVISTELKNIDPSKRGCLSDPSTNLTCFSFKACCSIEPYESTPTKTLKVLYTIEAETYNNNRKYSRVFFGVDEQNRKNVIKKNIQVRTNGQMDCREEIVFIKENTKDIQNPIKFRLNYTIVENPLPASGLEYLNPILDKMQADREFEASFQKDCGSDGVCESQLEVYGEMVLERQNDEYKFILGQEDEIQLLVTVTNKKDSAYESQLFVEHQSSVTYIAAGKHNGNVICNRFNKTMVACSLGNPLRRDALAQVRLRFDPSGLEDSEPKLSFKIFANSTSKQIAERGKTILHVSVIKQAELVLKGWAIPEQSFYGGEVKGESAMAYLDDIGTPIVHTYQIYNDGPWRAPMFDVFILWPHQVVNDKPQGKWLLYLESKPIVEGAGAGECYVESDHLINPLNLELKNEILDGTNDVTNSNKSITFTDVSSGLASDVHTIEGGSRVRRDRAKIMPSQRIIDNNSKKNVVHMECEKNSAKCIQINCKIFNMPRKTETYIHINSRLWMSTLVADYPRVDYINIASFANIKIPDRYNIKQKKKDDFIAVSSRAYPKLLIKTGAEQIPLWIYIISIIGGLLLLALFSFILYILGFFKRRRPDPTLSGNLEKNNENKSLIQNVSS